MKDIQYILSRVRCAVDKYQMIEEGDKIGIGISGGKDSLTLLCALSELRKFYPKKYDIVAIMIDMGFDKSPSIKAPKTEHEAIKELCDKLGVEFVVYKTEISSIIFDVRKESNPCSLCSRMRRGALHDACEELKCNKVALGHHSDDAVETAIMNLFFNGNYDTFSPVTYLSRKNIHVIRPLILTKEKDIKSFVKNFELPVEKSPCPADGNTERANMKEYLFQFEKDHRGLYERILGSLERGHISGWHE